MGEIRRYDIGGGPSGTAIGMMVASFWDQSLKIELKFKLEYLRDHTSRLSVPEYIEASVTELTKLVQLDGSAGKIIFFWGTCRLMVQGAGQVNKFFAEYYPDSHFGWMDIGPKLADNYGQDVVDEYKSTYASDN